MMYQARPTCFLCGRNGAFDPLDRHHLFGGALRNKSDRLGLTVMLCHNRCHIYGPEAAHNSPETMRMLHEYGQRVAMERFGWDVDDFRREFGKNYLSEEDQSVENVTAFGFTLLEEAALPY